MESIQNHRPAQQKQHPNPKIPLPSKTFMKKNPENPKIHRSAAPPAGNCRSRHKKDGLDYIFCVFDPFFLKF
jgi:hypothetical protein